MLQNSPRRRWVPRKRFSFFFFFERASLAHQLLLRLPGAVEKAAMLRTMVPTISCITLSRLTLVITKDRKPVC